MNHPAFTERMKLLARLYRMGALVLLNTVAFLVAVNALAWLLDRATSPPPGDVIIRKHGLEALRPVYPGYDETQIRALHGEMWGRSLAYEPQTDFKEPATTGKYVNVSPDGFRKHWGGPVWPAPTNGLVVFCFGGSTTFGYGVADDVTIPARLQARLKNTGNGSRPVMVYNFGRGYYTSTQERILFQKLIASRDLPHIAVFLDGINESVFPTDHSALFTVLDQAVQHMNSGPTVGGLVAGLPVAQWAARRWPRVDVAFAEAQRQALRRQLSDGVALSDSNAAELICRRYLDNIRMVNSVAKEFQVRPLFVWQPALSYNPPQQSITAGVIPEEYRMSAMVYRRMSELRQLNNPQGNFLWLADLHAGRAGPLYVDAFHYTADFCDAIAGQIQERIKALGWLE